MDYKCCSTLTIRQGYCMSDRLKIILLIILVLIVVFLAFFIGLVTGQKIVQKNLESDDIKLASVDRNSPKALVGSTKNAPKELSDVPKTSEKESVALAKTSSMGKTSEPNTDATDNGELGSDKASPDPTETTAKKEDKKSKTEETVNPTANKNETKSQKQEKMNTEETFGSNTIGKLLSTRKNSETSKSQGTDLGNNAVPLQTIAVGHSISSLSQTPPAYTISTKDPLDHYLAQKQMTALTSLGFKPYLVSLLNGTSSRYLLRIGEFDTRKGAELAVKDLPNIYKGTLEIIRISRKRRNISGTTEGKKEG